MLKLFSHSNANFEHFFSFKREPDFLGNLFKKSDIYLRHSKLGFSGAQGDACIGNDAMQSSA
jgi:hypothetical protein